MKPLAALVLCLGAAAGCGRHPHFTVASKNFVEELILGEMAAQQLERTLHIPVDRKLNLGGTLIAHQAMLNGDVDLYPEYLGTAANVVLRQAVTSQSVEPVYQLVKSSYESRFDLTWLRPLGFNDTFAMVVRRQDAEKLPAATLSAARARRWRLGIGYEFLTRADGLRSLDSSYSIDWEGTPKTMDLGLLYQALEQRQIDMAAANSTDAQLMDGRFIALSDDRKVFPPYEACFVVRRQQIRRNPAIAQALNQLEGRIREADMRQMNRDVIAKHEPVEKVVRTFLNTLGGAAGR